MHILGEKDRKIFIILCCCFLIFLFFFYTVYIRHEWFRRPLGYHDWWMTAHSVCVTKNWLKEGAFNLRFMHILNPASVEFDTILSRTPYVSYPPGALIPVFLFAKIFHPKDLILVYESYNLLSHCIIAIFLFLLMFMIIDYYKEVSGTNVFFSIVPSLIYLFTPPTLYWHQNEFFTDQAVMILFVLFIYFEMKRFLYGDLKLPANLLFIGIVFLGTLTDWLFVFIIIVAAALRIFFDDKPRNLWNCVLNTLNLTIPAVSAIALFLYQIVPLGLLPDLITVFDRRHLAGPDGVVTNFWMQHFVKFVIGGYGYILCVATTLCSIFLLFYFIFIMFKKREDDNKGMVKTYVRLVFLIGLPCLLQVYVFKQHSIVHAFSALKWALPLSLIPFGIFPVIFIRLMRPHQHHKFIISVFVILCVILLALGVFYRTSVLYRRFFGGVNDYDKKLGELVKRNVQYRDICFSFDFDIPEVPPQRLAYSEKRVYLIKLVKRNAQNKDIRQYRDIRFSFNFDIPEFPSPHLDYHKKRVYLIRDVSEIEGMLSRFVEKGARGKIFVHKVTWDRLGRDIEKICPVVYKDSDYYVCEIDKNRIGK